MDITDRPGYFAMIAWRIALVVLTCVTPITLQAQRNRVVAFDASMSTTRSFTATNYNGENRGMAVDLAASTTRGTVGNGGLVLALGATIQGQIRRGFITERDPSAPRVPEHPDINSFAALVGWQSRNGYVRVLAGPAIALADYTTGGINTRLELAAPPHSGVALTAHVRALTLPAYSGSVYHVVSVGAGFRLQR